MTHELASRKCAVASHTAAAVSILISAVLIGPFVAAFAQQQATPFEADAGFASSLDSARTRLEGQPVDMIKTQYLQCSGEATDRRLGGGEAALCSTIYEVLLQRHFGGDFSALLSWSRQQPAVPAQGDRVDSDAARAASLREISSLRGRWL